MNLEGWGVHSNVVLGGFRHPLGGGPGEVFATLWGDPGLPQALFKYAGPVDRAPSPLQEKPGICQKHDRKGHIFSDRRLASRKLPPGPQKVARDPPLRIPHT